MPFIDKKASSNSGGGNTGNYLSKDGDTLNGNLIVADGKAILPASPNGATLGTPERPFKDIYVGANSLYVDGNKVISSTNTTLNVSTDMDQHLAISTSGLGTTRLASSKEVILYSGDDVNIQAKGDVSTLTDGRLSFSTTIDGQDINFETKSNLGNINFKSKNTINVDSKEINFTVLPKVNGVPLGSVVTSLQGQTVTINEINSLSGVSSNVQQQINAIATGMKWKGSVTKYADLSVVYPTPQVGWFVVVQADELKDNGRSLYVYDGVQWTWLTAFDYVPTATQTIRGTVKLAGDLTGTSDAPVIKNEAIDANKLASNIDVSNKNFKVTDSLTVGGKTVDDMNTSTSNIWTALKIKQEIDAIKVTEINGGTW